jgi:hypothetical protein
LPLAWNVTGHEQRLPAELEGLHLTAGAPYHRGQLDVIDAFMAPALRLPRTIRGVEALVELADCDLMNTFGGWRVLTSNGETVLDQARLDALATHLQDAGIEPSLKALLVWVNSD